MTRKSFTNNRSTPSLWWFRPLTTTPFGPPWHWAWALGLWSVAGATGAMVATVVDMAVNEAADMVVGTAASTAATIELVLNWGFVKTAPSHKPL